MLVNVASVLLVWIVGSLASVNICQVEENPFPEENIWSNDGRLRLIAPLSPKEVYNLSLRSDKIEIDNELRQLWSHLSWFRENKSDVSLKRTKVELGKILEYLERIHQTLTHK